jgi:hypothetical protein
MPIKNVIGFEQSEKISENSIPYNKHSYKFLVDLSDEEFHKYTESRDILQGFLSDAQLFTIVVWNYREYQNYLEKCLDSYIQDNHNYFKERPIDLNINRIALNYLSSVRTYLDHTETNLDRRYGKTSDIFANYTSSCSQAYDSCFAYRFLYKLRDYSQHCGFPITNITLNVDPNDDEIEKPIYSLEVSADRDILLSRFDWKKLRPEIKAQPSKININAHIDNLMDCLNDINTKVTKDIFSTLLDAATYIQTLLNKAPNQDGTIGIYSIEVVEDAEGNPTEIKRITGSPIPARLITAVIKGSIDDIIKIVEF